MCNGKSVTQLDARTYVFSEQQSSFQVPLWKPERESKVHLMGLESSIPTGNQDNVRYISFFSWFDFPCSIECNVRVQCPLTQMDWSWKAPKHRKATFLHSLSNYNFLSHRDCMALQCKLPSSGAYRSTSIPPAALRSVCDNQQQHETAFH